VNTANDLAGIAHVLEAVPQRNETEALSLRKLGEIGHHVQSRGTGTFRSILGPLHDPSTALQRQQERAVTTANIEGPALDVAGDLPDKREPAAQAPCLGKPVAPAVVVGVVAIEARRLWDGVAQSAAAANPDREDFPRLGVAHPRIPGDKPAATTGAVRGRHRRRKRFSPGGRQH